MITEIPKYYFTDIVLLPVMMSYIIPMLFYSFYKQYSRKVHKRLFLGSLFVSLSLTFTLLPYGFYKDSIKDELQEKFVQEVFLEKGYPVSSVDRMPETKTSPRNIYEITYFNKEKEEFQCNFFHEAIVSVNCWKYKKINIFNMEN